MTNFRQSRSSSLHSSKSAVLTKTESTDSNNDEDYPMPEASDTRPSLIYLHQFFATPEATVGTRSYEMARRLVRRGFRVHMIASPTGAVPKVKHEIVEGIEVHWIGVPYRNEMSYARRIVAFVQFSVLASIKSVRLRADIVFATSTPLTIVIPALVCKWIKRIPMVFEVRDLWPELPIAMGALKNPMAIRAAHRLERLAYHQSAHVIGLSPGMCDGIASTGIARSRISEIPNSCDLNRFDVPPHVGKIFREERPWLEDRPLVLYAGTFGRINDVAWLAELAASMKKIDPEVRFLAIGDGYDRDTIADRAAKLDVLNKTFFIENRIAKRDIPSCFAAATVSCSLFLPVKEMENNSANKFFDALAAGKPVLINYKGWHKELVENSRIGLAVDHADPDAAACKLSELLDSPTELAETGKRSRKLGITKFSRSMLAAELGDALISTLPKHLRTKLHLVEEPL